MLGCRPRACRPSRAPSAHAHEARAVLVAIDKLRAKLEPVAMRQGLEWDDLRQILKHVDKHALEAANDDPENFLLNLSRPGGLLDGIGEIGIHSETAPGCDHHPFLLRLAQQKGRGGEPLSGSCETEIGSPRATRLLPNRSHSPPAIAGWQPRLNVSPLSQMRDSQQHQPEPPPTKGQKVTRVIRVLYTGFNSILVQAVLYIVYILAFQALIAAVRVKEEVYLTKYLVDNIIEEPITDLYDNDQVRRLLYPPPSVPSPFAVPATRLRPNLSL